MIRCAAVLGTAILGLAIADNARPWKRLQSDFFDLERRQLSSRLDAARGAAAANLADLEARIESERQALTGRHHEISELEHDLSRFRGKLRAAELRRGRLAAGKTAELTEELRQARIEVESLAELIADREGKLGAVRSELDAARRLLARERSPIEALEARLAQLPGGSIEPIASLFAPGAAVRELALPRSLDAGGEAGTGGGPRVDRCVTCHLAAARDDVESAGWPRPLRRHPRPELFLGASSPHPYEGFGCTVCHGGDGRSTDFARAGHVPATAEQEADWRRRLRWRRDPDRKAMLPLDLTEAACGRCHGEEVFFPEAPALDAGRQLITALGCAACHPSDHPSLHDLPKTGPSLAGIAGKTSPAWVHRWLEAPRASRPTTWMPHFFDPESDPGERRGLETRAIVDYLWQSSRPAAYDPPPAGDVEAGRTLFRTLGCEGCHLLGLGAETPSLERRHGPHLAGTGSKVTAGWLHAWLLDPRSYRADSSMPSLRLEETEAADLTAYLMTRRDPAWEGLELPAIDAGARDRQVLAHLARDNTLEDSQARLERMNEREKNAYLGQRSIAGHGCHGCHRIPGFEDAAAAGPGLDEVAGRLREALASRPPESPGRWLPASHRPSYRLSGGEARAVAVAVLGLAGGGRPRGENATVLATGRRILARYNCRGCHRIEGRGGPAEAAAPDLAHVGARLESSWLFAYLIDPGRARVRPWLETRMPTFGLSPAETNALVRYFALRAGRGVFAAAPPTPPPASGVAVGRVVFGMLQCDDCHRTGGDTPQLAPSYLQASKRLRPDWVTAWILDPERWLPGTPMPANFRPGAGEELDSTFLIGSIHTPIFAVEKDRLVRLLGSEEALHEYLSDPERVAAALRDYLWTL